jgi:glycosyltransferase involved in cell wall biosynthesis
MINDLNAGGAEKVFVDLANYLDNFYSVKLVVIQKKGSLVERLSSRVQIIELGGNLSFAIVRIAKFLLREKPKIIISTLKEVNSSLLLAKKMVRSDVKVIIREANLLSAELSYERSFRQRIKYLMIRLSYRYADAVVCLGDILKEDMLNVLPYLKTQKIHVIYNPVDYLKIQEMASKAVEIEKEEDVHTFVQIGRLYPTKGHLLMLKAISILKKKGLRIRFLIVGAGNYESKLRQEIVRLKIGKEVMLIGFSKNPYPFMKMSDTFVLPSYFEGMPNSLLEAMALNMNVVCSAGAGAGPEVLLKSGYGEIFEKGDVNSLVSKLEISINRCTDKKNFIPYLSSNHEKNIIFDKYRLVLESMLN